MMRLWRWLSENSRGWNRWDPIEAEGAMEDLWGPYSLGIWDGLEWDDDTRRPGEMAAGEQHPATQSPSLETIQPPKGD